MKNLVTGIILCVSLTNCFADSLSCDDIKTEYLRLKMIDSLSVKLSNDYNRFFKIDRYILGEGFNVSKEIQFARNINSIKAERYFKTYSFLTWYSLIGIIGSTTALMVMAGYEGGADPTVTNTKAIDFRTPAKICGVLLATTPLTLTFRVVCQRKAIIHYNNDLKDYADNLYKNKGRIH